MKKLFLSIFSTLLLVCAILIGGYWQAAYTAKPSPNATPLAFVIQGGETVKNIAQQLQASGIINSATSFEIFAKLNNVAGQLEAGNFQLKPGMSFQDVANVLANAVGQDVQITIPEGKTAAQILPILQAAIPTVSASDWSASTGPQSVVLATTPDFSQHLPSQLSTNGLEGFLFPDTYRLDPKSQASNVVQALLTNFIAKAKGGGLPANWSQTTALPIGTTGVSLTPYQIVILASILQQEVKQPADMKNAADIFLKRLAANMPLQSDATVSYAVGHADLSTLDLASPSPYNTYAHTGLPPGPIDNPGLDALEAVVNPTPNDWYYFLTTPDGTAVYAKTYDEQVANKQKYLD